MSGTFVNMGVLEVLGGLIVTVPLLPRRCVGKQWYRQSHRAMVGAFHLGVMNNSTSILGIAIDWQQKIKGLMLLLAAFFDVYNKNKNA